MNTELLALLIVKAILDWLNAQPKVGNPITKEQLDEVDAKWKSALDKWVV
jgi:hypothetical protein